MCIKRFSTTAQFPYWQLSHSLTRGFGISQESGKGLSNLLLQSEAPTMHMGHLPVRDVHLLIIPQGQWERDSITSCEDSRDVGLHHLQGGSKSARGWGLHPTANRDLPESHHGP